MPVDNIKLITYYLLIIILNQIFTHIRNKVDSAAYVLDLDISINVEGKFSCKVYDKRDNFGFKVVKFQPLMSNQASSVLYGTYYSQLERYSKICNDVDAFSDRVLKFIDSRKSLVSYVGIYYCRSTVAVYNAGLVSGRRVTERAFLVIFTCLVYNFAKAGEF